MLCYPFFNVYFQVYEFHGCMYHGCIACYPNRKNKLPKSTMTAEEAFVKTREREDRLKAAGLSVI